MTAYSESFNENNHDFVMPGDTVEIEQLGNRILQLATEDLTRRNGPVLYEGRYHRSYSGTMSDVMISARVFDIAAESGTFRPAARYSLFLSALMLAESEHENNTGLTARGSGVIELESIEISGSPFEERFAPLRPESEEWPTLEAPYPSVVYMLNGDILSVPKLNDDQRRLAAVALAQAFVVKYGINDLTPADSLGAFWPDTDPQATQHEDGGYDYEDGDEYDPIEPLPTIEEEEELLARYPD